MFIWIGGMRESNISIGDYMGYDGSCGIHDGGVCHRIERKSRVMVDKG